MQYKEYLLDANIIIRLWKEYPRLLDEMDKSELVNFKISQQIAEELSVKEFGRYNGVPILSEKFLKLLGHIVNSSNLQYENTSSSVKIKYDQTKNNYFVNDNKISMNDMDLILICRNNSGYILVTEDKRMMQSAKSLLDSSRVINYKQFIDDIINYIN